MISVVVPVYKCRETLVALHRAVTEVLTGSAIEFELILVDDGSSDGGWGVIQAIAASDPRVRGIKLSRNFGQHAAIMAGMRAVKGSAAVLMDCDLEDPVEMIPEFLSRLDEADIVISLRQAEGESTRRRLQSWAFAKFLRLLTGERIDTRSGGFSALSRKVVDEYVKFNERDHHYLYVLLWLGFPKVYVPIVRRNSLRGRSSYSFLARLQHAFAGGLFHSSRIMVGAALAGCAFAASGMVLLVAILIRAMSSAPASGWLSIVSLLLVVSGLNVILVSIVGVYVSRTFIQTKHRPLYVVSEVT